MSTLSTTARSPHARGCTDVGQVGGKQVAPFPARAGMHRWAPSPPPARPAVPRTRGDAPFGLQIAACATVRSPHARGCTDSASKGNKHGKPFPARAGMHRSRRPSSRTPASVPRTRGDAPNYDGLSAGGGGSRNGRPGAGGEGDQDRSRPVRYQHEAAFQSAGIARCRAAPSAEEGRVRPRRIGLVGTAWRAPLTTTGALRRCQVSSLAGFLATFRCPAHRQQMPGDFAAVPWPKWYRRAAEPAIAPPAQEGKVRTRRTVFVGLAWRTPSPATRGLVAPGGSMSPPTFRRPVRPQRLAGDFADSPCAHYTAAASAPCGTASSCARIRSARAPVRAGPAVHRQGSPPRARRPPPG